MKTPTIEIGAIVTHPSLEHPVEVYKYYYSRAPGITILGPDQPPKPRIWSGKVYCKHTDANGIEHKYHLFPEAELTVIG